MPNSEYSQGAYHTPMANEMGSSQSPGGEQRKRRHRVSSACDQCRSQKVKCSGSSPCSNCLRHHRVCSFHPVGTASLVTKPLPPHVSQVAELQSRIKHLEGLLQTGTALSPGFTECSTFIYLKDKWRLHRRLQNMLTSNLGEHLFKQLSPESQAVVQPPRVQFYGWNMSGLHYLKPVTIPPFQDLVGDRKMEQELLDYFFRELNPFFGIIHEPVFREQYAFVSMSSDSPTRLFTALLYLILPLAMRFSSTAPSGLEESLFEAALEVVQKLSFEWESFELIQAWLLIYVYLRVLHRQTSLGHALGSAIAMTRSMSLNYGSTSPKHYNNIKAKRIFWCVYTWDKINGLQDGKYYSFKDGWDVHLVYPERNWPQESDGWLTFPALAMVRLAQIAGRVQTFRLVSLSLEEVEAITEELGVWLKWIEGEGIFDTLADQTLSPAIQAQLRLHYYDVVTQLHIRRLFNLVGVRVATKQLSFDVLLRACSGVLTVFAAMEQHHILETPWPTTLLLLFQVGIISIILINAGLYVAQCNRQLATVVQMVARLDKAGDTPLSRFKMAGECLWALKMLNRMVSLRLRESVELLELIGIDHGSDEVNTATFSQFEALKKEALADPEVELSELGLDSVAKEFSDDDLFANLQWFDQTSWNFEYHEGDT